MKKFSILFVFLFLFYSFTQAQNFQFYRVGPAITVHDTTSFYPVVLKGYFKNTSSVNQNFKLIRILNSLPGPTWSSSLCAGGSCYPDYVDTVPPFGADPITMAPNQGDTLFIDVLGLTQGLGKIVMKCFVLSNPSVYIIDTFKVQLNYHTGVNQIGTTVENYRLEQNYPNPFNPSTNIEFSIPKREFVSLKIYNVLGEEIAVPVNDIINEGRYRYELNATALRLSSGLYYYRLQTGEFVQTRKMILAK
jgi:hypothetical protein